MASKRRVRFHECGRKKKYATSKEAHRDIQAMKKREARPINAYHCKWCGSFHVGHTNHPEAWNRL